jgi:hypothetical protein
VQGYTLFVISVLVLNKSWHLRCEFVIRPKPEPFVDCCGIIDETSFR